MLHCARGIQERIGAVNDEAPAERRVSFRIGVHVGEAMVRSGGFFGDAVNVAARMQGLAELGSACVSGAAYDYVRTALPLKFEDIGAQRVKNLEVPIRAYLARPSGAPLSRALPPVHRCVEAHLARRLHALCHAAMMEVVGPKDLEPVEFAAIASIHDAPGSTRLVKTGDRPGGIVNCEGCRYRKMITREYESSHGIPGDRGNHLPINADAEDTGRSVRSSAHERPGLAVGRDIELDQPAILIRCDASERFSIFDLKALADLRMILAALHLQRIARSSRSRKDPKRCESQQCTGSTPGR
jgi:adenylate/guanylate cyclase family protein